MLEGQRFVGFARGLVIRRQVDRFLRGQGVGVDVALEFDSIENIKKAIEVAAGPVVAAEIAGTHRSRRHQPRVGNSVPLILLLEIAEKEKLVFLDRCA